MEIRKLILVLIVIGTIFTVFYGVSKQKESQLITINEGIVAHKNGEYEKAVVLLKQFAEKGYEDAQLTMGIAYAFGQGVEKNQEKAKEYLLVATKEKAPGFYFWIASSFEKGDGVKKNTEEAIRWYGIAAGAGHPAANQHKSRLVKQE